MKILGFTRGGEQAKMDAVQYYRVFSPLREVNDRADGISAQAISEEAVRGVPDSFLAGRDVYTMCRLYLEDMQAFLNIIHSWGGVLVLDCDDDLTEEHKLVSGRGEEFKRVLSMTDYVTTSTQPLADRFAQYTKWPPVVLKNHLDTDWFIAKANEGKRVIPGLTMGFSGSPTHWGDWRKPSVPFARILREYDVQGILHGEIPRYLTHAAKDLIPLGGVPYSIYPCILKQFDILICAVDVGDEFNAGKSAVKALEAMAVGAVPICSRFDPYLDLQVMGAPVVVVEEDTPAGWYKAMQWVVRHKELRTQLSSEGPAWVKSHRDMAVSGYKQWEEFYRGIAD